MEGLHIALKNAVSLGLIQGASIGESVTLFNVFYLASGLKINVSKSNVYGLGVDQQDIEAMARDTGCGSGRLNIGSLKVFNLDLLKNGDGVLLTIHILFGLVLLRLFMEWKQVSTLWGAIAMVLYHLDTNADCFLSDRRVNNSWIWDWKRQVLGSRNEANLEDLVSELGQVQLIDKPDSWTWILDNDDVFTVHATRVHLDSWLLPSCSPCTRWPKSLPRKVNIFVWRLALDRLPTRLNLSLRGLDIPSIMCPMCNNGWNPLIMSFLAVICLQMFGVL
ncbi:RNA-directed DNA polymerase, eukaryota, reverse transcriptase zinc-binding domain protein [Tanacetum coccineum]